MIPPRRLSQHHIPCFAHRRAALEHETGRDPCFDDGGFGASGFGALVKGMTGDWLECGGVVARVKVDGAKVRMRWGRAWM